MKTTTSETIHVFSDDLTRRARFIFGEYVEAAFFSYEAKSDRSDIRKGMDIGRLSQQVASDQPNTLHEIVMPTAGEVVILFANGKSVAFGVTEWGEIRCQKELNPVPES